MGLFDFMKKKKDDEDFLDMGSPTANTFGGAPGPAGEGISQPNFSQPPMGGFAQQPPMSGMGDLPGMTPEMPPQQQQRPMMSMSGQMQNTDMLNERIQTLNYKLDALKSILDAINAKLANIEQATRGKDQQGQSGWNY